MHFLEEDLRASFDYKAPSRHQKKLLFNRNVTGESSRREKIAQKRGDFAEVDFAHEVRLELLRYCAAVKGMPLCVGGVGEV